MGAACASAPLRHSLLQHGYTDAVFDERSSQLVGRLLQDVCALKHQAQADRSRAEAETVRSEQLQLTVGRCALLVGRASVGVV